MQVSCNFFGLFLCSYFGYVSLCSPKSGGCKVQVYSCNLVDDYMLNNYANKDVSAVDEIRRQFDHNLTLDRTLQSFIFYLAEQGF